MPVFAFIPLATLILAIICGALTAINFAFNNFNFKGVDCVSFIANAMKIYI